MLAKGARPTILQRMKLYRPPLPADHVRRAGLLKILLGEGSHPTVLVSAPAGYGKSTLVADKVFRDVEDSEFTGYMNEVTISIPEK